ncbi:Zinc ion binding [Paramecium bursaria]
MSFLICQGCENNFDNILRIPRTLGCGHTLCQACIKQTTTCPSDDSIFQMKSMDQFPINGAILALVDKDRGRSRTLTQPIQSTSPEFFKSLNKKSPSPIRKYDKLRQLHSELEYKIKLRFQDIQGKLELRKQYVLKELESIIQSLEQAKMDNYNLESVNIDFQAQMDVLIQRFCQISLNKEIVINPKKEIDSLEPREFVTFSNQDSVETLRISPSKRIFENRSPPNVRTLISKNYVFKETLIKIQNGLDLEIVNLKSQNLADQEIQQLSNALFNTRSKIRIIKLSKNSITDVGFKFLIQSLLENRTIKIIKLKINKISELSLQYLINVFEKDKKSYIQQIFLQGNQITHMHNYYITELTKLGLIIYI